MKTSFLLTSSLVAATMIGCTDQAKERELPNILFAISDDQSFPHASAYGCTWVNTPAFDRVAREGILFNNAFTPNTKCAPSRSVILTGRNPWQLEAAANHNPFFPEKFKTYPEAMIEHGYFVGHTAKGWGPGNVGMVDGKPRQLTGPAFNKHTTTPPADFISNNDYAVNFEDFLDSRPEGMPFFFWYGGHEPHRAYEFMAGVNKGNKNLSDIEEVPGFWPDRDTIRHDMLDYAFEIEYFDLHLERMLRALEERGLLENTVVIVTSDNGMPFPRMKGHAMWVSNHVPLAVMWPKGIRKPGRVIDKFVSFKDFAPTFLELAGISWQESGMQPFQGNSIVSILKNKAHGRDYALFGKERTDVGRPDDVGYPVRGIADQDYVYIRNYAPDRWFAGNPEVGYPDSDASPTKTLILNERRRIGRNFFWEQNFGKRPAEELYRRDDDPYKLTNLADDPAFEEVKNRLKAKMEQELRDQEDPRILGYGHVFDAYPYAPEMVRNFYNRIMNGENVPSGWISKSDVETEPIDYYDNP